MGVDVTCGYFAQLTSPQQLPDLLTFISDNNQPRLVIGAGSNILFTQPFNGLGIHNAIKGMSIIKQDASHVWLLLNWIRRVGA